MKRIILGLVPVLALCLTTVAQMRDPRGTTTLIVSRVEARAALNGECLNLTSLVAQNGEVSRTHVGILITRLDEVNVTTGLINALGIVLNSRAIDEREPIPAGFHDVGFAEPGKRLIARNIVPIRFCD